MLFQPAHILTITTRLLDKIVVQAVDVTVDDITSFKLLVPGVNYWEARIHSAVNVMSSFYYIVSTFGTSYSLRNVNFFK